MKLDEIDKYMEQHNNQLPPGTDETYRAKLLEGHFYQTDRSANFFKQKQQFMLSVVVHGFLAFREPMVTDSLRRQCKLSQLLQDGYNIVYLPLPSNPATEAEAKRSGMVWTSDVGNNAARQRSNGSKRTVATGGHSGLVKSSDTGSYAGVAKSRNSQDLGTLGRIKQRFGKAFHSLGKTLRLI